MKSSIKSSKGFVTEDYLAIFVKRRWAILTVVTIIIATVTLYSFLSTPIYTGTVQILIERQAPRLLDLQAPSAGQYDSSEEFFYQTQYKLMESPALAKIVAKKLNLRNHPYYSQVFKNLPANADEAARQAADEKLVGAILSGVKVSPVRQSHLVNLSFSHPDPKFAAQVANALGQAYVEQSLDLHFAASQEAAGWLQQKITEERKKLEASEAKLNQYKRDQQIITSEDRESITAQKLEALNKELVTVQTRRMEAEARFKQLEKGGAISQVLNNPLIQNLKGPEARVIAEQSELGRKFGEDHPRMIRLKNELAAIRQKISAETSQIIQSVKNEYHMALAQETELKAALETQKDNTQDMSDRVIQYRVLLRDVETNRALYDNMLKSLKTTTATENVSTTNIRIVYPATVPSEPVSPKKGRNVFLAVVLGIFFGTALGFGLEGLDTSLKTPGDVESWLEIPTLAVIPHLEFFSDSLVGDDPKLAMLQDQTMASETYRGLRTSILFSTPGHSPHVLLVTSSLPMEGKTLTAANLAAAMAKAETKVLVVDSDLRRPTQHQLFQLPKEPGLSNFLVGEIDELPVQPTMVPNLFLVPAGAIPPNPSELLGSARMREFLTRAREQFGRIILDSPPLISVTDAAILATQSEGVLMVIKAGSIPRRSAMEAKSQLLEVKATILGAVFNNVQLRRHSYYYNYNYQYSSYYSDGPTVAGEERHSRPQAPPHGIIASLKSYLPFGRQNSSQGK